MIVGSSFYRNLNRRIAALDRRERWQAICHLDVAAASTFVNSFDEYAQGTLHTPS